MAVPASGRYQIVPVSNNLTYYFVYGYVHNTATESVAGQPNNLLNCSARVEQLNRLCYGGTILLRVFQSVDKQHIAAVLASTDGNVTRAAEILRVDRVTVYKKIKKCALRT